MTQRDRGRDKEQTREIGEGSKGEGRKGEGRGRRDIGPREQKNISGYRGDKCGTSENGGVIKVK